MRKKSTRIHCTAALFSATVVALFAGTAEAAIVINEVLGSTTSFDTEYIELFNTGPAPVDISGWEIELWDSDAENFGGADAASPYFVPASTTLNVGDYFLFANALAEAAFNVTADELLPSNSIENSS
ncbi:MAG: lamin tail domain-containing protein [Planctomycetota bacterium]|nr:lamin tail domain-containing protein [Planctomycetota bacterium]